MALLGIDAVAGTFDHRCETCGAVRRGLSCDPACGDVRLVPGDRSRALQVRMCPTCRAAGVYTSEGLWLNHSAAAAGETGHQPHLEPSGAEQKRWIRALQRHPALAPHAPPHEDWLAQQQGPQQSAQLHPNHQPQPGHAVHDFDALDGVRLDGSTDAAHELKDGRP